MPNEVIITDEMRRPDERVKVNPFRHPWIKGTDTDPECGRTWHDHGWIDRGDHGFTVCPTQAERPDVLRDREAAAEQRGRVAALREAAASLPPESSVGPGWLEYRADEMEAGEDRG